jgi:hypothetical protein
MSKVYNRLAQLEAQREHALHQQRLRKIKPSLKVEAPVSMEYQHLKVNAKKKLMIEGVLGFDGSFSLASPQQFSLPSRSYINQSVKNVLWSIT